MVIKAYPSPSFGEMVHGCVGVLLCGTVLSLDGVLRVEGGYVGLGSSGGGFEDVM